MTNDPTLFQHLLQYLWSGAMPMVLSPRSIGMIKKQGKSFMFKNERLYKKIIRNGHLHHASYVPSEDLNNLIRQYHLTLGHIQTHTLLPLLEVRYFWPNISKDITDY